MGTTEFKILHRGTLQETVECQNCKQMFNYPTWNEYNYCPYCGARKGNEWEQKDLTLEK